MIFDMKMAYQRKVSRANNIALARKRPNVHDPLQ
jgi:hypothetical protein